MTDAPSKFRHLASRTQRGRQTDIWMFVFLALLPHYSLPTGFAYPLPIASVYLAVSAAVVLAAQPHRLHFRFGPSRPLRALLLAFFLYCVVSTLYGAWHLESMNRNVLHLQSADVTYATVAGQRMLQLILAVTAFELLRSSRWPLQALLRGWLIGTCLATFVHGLVYVFVDDELSQRAGVFTEGNQGGLYYLISIFLALEYRRRRRSTESLAFLCTASAGLLLTRSSAAVVALAIALVVRQLLVAKTVPHGVYARVIAALTGTAVSTGTDFGLTEKLFEEEVTSNSFSRFDRIASVETALVLASEAPTFGHGLQSYGFLSNDYLDGPLAAMYDGSFRRIPNNIYAEVVAETGLVGLFLLILIIIRMVRLVASSPEDPARALMAGMVGVFIYWFAFPTYSVVFVWVFFGIACNSAVGHVQSRKTPSSKVVQVTG
jgi:O-Antigen ligase